MAHSRLCFLFLWMLLLPVFCLPAVAAPVLSNGNYLILMSDSEMTVGPATPSHGARVILWPFRPEAVWQFVHLGNDIYRINCGSLVLDSRESKRYNGVPAIIWNWHGAGNQRWKIIPKGEHYNIVNITTGLALDLPDNRREKDNKLQGYARSATEGQLFDIRPIGTETNKMYY